MVGQASALKDAVNSAPNLLSTVSHFFGDPVLQKEPSAALALRQYLLQQQGWSPIAEADLRSIQQKLSDAGYLDSGDVNGVWTASSQQAFYKATQDHIEQQQQSSGGFSITHALSALMPTHWIPALAGAAEALPGELRSLAANVVGGLDTLGSLVIPTNMGNGNGYLGGALNSGAHTAYDIDRLLGDRRYHSVNQYQANSIFGGSAQDLTNNLNAILTVMPVTKAADAGAAGIEGAVQAGEAANAAAANAATNSAAGTSLFRGMFTDLGPEAATRGPGRIAKAIYNSGGGGLMRNRLFEQSPVARFLAPPIRAVFDPESKSLAHYYYAGRTLAAQPTRVAGVQALQNAAGAAQTAGWSEEAINAIENKLGVHNSALSNQIHAQGLIGGRFGTALDLLSGAFHGPISTADTLRAEQEGRQVLIGVSASHTVGQLVDGFSSYMDRALGPTNVGWAIHEALKLDTPLLSRAVNAARRQDTVEQMVGKYGQPFVQAYFNNKINQYAAVHYAEDVLREQHADLPVDSPDRLAYLQEYSHAALTDPQLLKQNRDALLGNMAELYWRFLQDGNRIHQEMESEFRQGMDRYSQAWQPMTTLVTKHARELVTPQALDALDAAQKEHDFNTALGTATGEPPQADMQFLAANHPGVEHGSLGLARRDTTGENPLVETQTDVQMIQKADQLAAELKAAGDPSVNVEDLATAPAFDPAKVQRVRQEAINYLFHYRGLTPRELDGKSTDQLIQIVREASKLAPKEVSLALDASPEARAAWQQIQDAGYKVVAGTDIGHVFQPPVIDPVLVEGYHSAWRKIATVMGLNNMPVAIKDAGMIRRTLTERAIQDGINNGLIRVPPGMNAARIHMLVLDRLQQRHDLSPGEKAAYAVGDFFGMHDRAARYALGENASAEDIAAYKQRAQAEIARSTQPIEVKPSSIVKALTTDTPASIKEAVGEPLSVFRPVFDEQSANTIADAYIRAMVHEPAWVFGAGKLEDLYRAGFGFLGTRAAEKFTPIRRLSRLPNATIRTRNRYRFQLDPMFSMKRVAKTALKAAIPGDHGISAPLTVSPLRYMSQRGYAHKAFDVLDRVMPMRGAEGFDTNDRLLYENDAFGIYNPRHHMALRAYELDKAGLSDEQIRKDLTRTFTYGDRTAFERTLGTIWYPFSFEKTLWRNVGSYMLDRPGSILAANAAFSAYHALSQHEHIGDWLKQHAPILKELQKMNAFEHGIGPGQVGGINAVYAPALWNLFGPQKYGAMKDPSTNFLEQAFPVLRELNSMLVGYSPYSGTMPGGRPNGSLVQQLGIGLWGLTHSIDAATAVAGLGKPFDAINRNIVIPGRPATYQAQQDSAWAYRNALILKLAGVLDYNYHNRGGELRWGKDALGGVAGQVVNRSTIDEVVHARYPDFDPTAAQSLAVTKKTQMTRYLSDLAVSDPQRAAAYQQFVAPAEKLRPLLQRAITQSGDPALFGQLAQIENTYREYAVNLSEQDPEFLKFYNEFYLSEFGPIEAVTF